MSSEELVYAGEVRLANQIREFLGRDVGDYLVGRAQIEMEEAKDAMTRINPFWPGARRKLARLQQEYLVAEKFLKWLNDALQNGDIALAQLEAMDDEF